MRQFRLTIRPLRAAITLIVALLILATPLAGVAEESIPIESEAPAAPVTGGLQITLSGSDGTPLSGAFGVSDGSGMYQEVWANDGIAAAWNLASPISVSQLTGTVDYLPDYAPRSVDIVPGGTVSLSFVNAFLDADEDAIGDSVDVCPAGNDTVDTDGDYTADACDSTPNGDNDGDGIDNQGDVTPNGDSDGDGVDNAVDACTSGDDALDTDGDGLADACDDSPEGDASAPEPTIEPTEAPTVAPVMDSTTAPTDQATDITLEVDEEPVVVASAPVSCQQADAVSPWLKSDLDDYPPGGLVTLSGGGWVPGQMIEILVEDDGIADAEQGEWNHRATVTADETGAFSYAFNIAPWFVADYTVTATGECAQAQTAFTDSVQGGNCVQVTASDVISPGAYIMFRCASTQNPIRISVTAISAGWQWAYIFSSDSNLAPPLYSSLNWQTTGTAGDSSASGNINQAYFFLSPTTSVLPGATGTVSIHIKRPDGSSILYTSNITAHRSIAASDFTLSCAPALSTIAVTSSGLVTCTLSALSIAAGASASATIGAPAAPAGWTLTATTPLTGSVTQSTPLRVTFSLAPSCASSVTSQTVPVTSTLVISNPNTVQPPQVTGPTSSFAMARSSATTLAVHLTSATLDWTRAYSFRSYPLNPGSLSYALDAVGCSGWNVQVSASPFVAGTGATVPASNLTLTGSTTPSGAGLSRPTTSGPLNTGATVLSASPASGIGSFTQTLNLNLNMPAGTLVGVYTSTITITAAAGP